MKDNLSPVLLISDVHLNASEPLPPAYRLLKKYARDRRWDKVIIIGDFLDCNSISPHNKGHAGLVEGARLAEDFKLAIKELSFWAGRCDEVVYCRGNHEEWITRYVEDFPTLAGLVDLDTQVFAHLPTVTPVPFNKPYFIGDVAFIHGQFTNIYCAKKHLDEMGCSVMFGHTHRIQSHVRKYLTGKYIVAQSFGCLSGEAPHYMRNRHTSQAHGFGEFLFYDGGFGYDVVMIKDNKFARNNKLYTL